MANPLKGEVDLVHDGASYRLRFTVDALIQLEADLDLTVGEIAKTGDGINITVLRSMFWAALLAHHEMSKSDVSDLMGEIGIITASAATMEAFMLAFPTEAANAPARPRKTTKAGTG